MTSPDSPSDPGITDGDTRRAIDRLNRELLALSMTDGELDTAQMERTAKALSATLRSLEQLDAYRAAQPDVVRAGELLSDAEVDDLLARMQRMVDNGVLDARHPSSETT